ncbi:L,D-transpeptidase [Chachezhania antarctica]|uniref:L,D-transpeptidase n=1 Tax=Chachezhania antarctica TaxID=2340860 RepID=UPI001968FBF2|nr:L,D-transpeptidase [Chachezhania antarctica]
MPVIMRMLLSAALILCLWVPAVRASSLIAYVDLSDQRMTVMRDGYRLYDWPVSSGRSGYRTPVGQYSAQWLSRHHRSRKYNNAPMPHSIFFHGGYAIHGTNDLARLGRPASHGCIRLHPDHAAMLFQMTQEAGTQNMRVVIVQ